MHSDVNNSAIYFLQQPNLAAQELGAKSHSFDLPSGVVNLVANSLDTDSLLNLSRVNRKCYHLFSNDKYFKDHFFNKICKIFPGLENPFNDASNIQHAYYVVHSYPGNCWKVFCWVFSKPNCRNFPIPKSNIEYEKVLRNLQVGWKMLIEKTLPEEIKKICGAGYADQSSMIHKAWLLSQESKIRIDAMSQEGESFSKNNADVIEEVSEILKSDYKENGYNLICEFTNKWEMSDKTGVEILEKKLEYFLEEQKSHMNKNFIEIMSMSVEGFRELAEYKKEIAKKICNFGFSSTFLSDCVSIYDNLELKRVELNEETKRTSDIAEINKNIRVEEFKEIHIIKLVALKNLFIFKSNWADQVTKNKELFRMLVNSTSMRTKIWKELYDKCADGKIENNWSENHFHHHFGICVLILDQYVGPTRKQLEYLDGNKNFKLMWLEQRARILNLLKTDSLKGMNILGQLYALCAQNKIEENWSENHFHEHLGKLEDVMTQEFDEVCRGGDCDAYYILKELLLEIRVFSDLNRLVLD